ALVLAARDKGDVTARGSTDIRDVDILGESAMVASIFEIFKMNSVGSLLRGRGQRQLKGLGEVAHGVIVAWRGRPRGNYYSSDIDPTLPINVAKLVGADLGDQDFMLLVLERGGSVASPGTCLPADLSDAPFIQDQYDLPSAHCLSRQ
ncbi:unnamed protein product, partial [Prorocentrum cordatum]